VGNLSVGGTGKTPVVELLARLLRESGRKPAILTRGYGRVRVLDGAYVVSDGVRVRGALACAGDEPLMLARNLPGVAVIVSPDRYLGGRLAERRFRCDVHVLDDGFQHVQLDRDVDLLLIGDDEIDRPQLLPFGRLREPLDAARHADALLWTGPDRHVDTAATLLRVPVAFDLRRAPGAVYAASPGHPVPESGARVVAVAAIARPLPFVDALRAAGFEVAVDLTWPDHHRFTAADVDRVRAAVSGARAACAITTEKDMVRLTPFEPLPFVLAWRRLEVRIEPADVFAAWLAERIREAEAGRAGRGTRA
jgi:tetraacyldisaccharide 4'-kinase